MAGPIKVRILGDVDGLRSSLKEGEDHVEGWAGRVGGHFSGLIGTVGKLAAGVAAIGVGAGAAFLGDAIGKAGDLGETQSKVNQIFGDGAAALDQWSTDAAKAMGQSKQAALDAAANFGIFGKAAGLTGNDLTDFSKELTGLAGDLASFGNTSPEEAAEALGAALRGEAEPMRKFGVLLDDATLKAKALEMGIYDGNGSLTQQQKILAAQRSIMDQTSDAQGDFARTSGGLANQQRILRAQLANTSAEIGAKLLPVATTLATWANTTLIPILGKWGGLLADKLAPALRAAVEWVRHLVGALRTGTVWEDTPRSVALIATAMMNLGRWVRDDALPALRAFAGWVRDEVIPRVVQLAGWVRDDLIPAISSMVGWFKDNVVPVIATVVGWIKDNLIPAVMTAAEWIGTHVVEAVKGFAGWVRDDLIPRLSELWSWLQEKLGPTLQDTKEWWESDVLPAIQKVSAWFNDEVLPILKKVAAWIDENLGPILKWLASAVLDEVIDGFKRAVGFIADYVIPAFRELISFGILVASKWVEMAGKAVEFARAVKDRVGEAVDFIRDLPNRIGDLSSTLWGAGQDLVRGFIDGIRSMAATLVNEAKSVIVDTPVNAVRSALGINSPSRVFMEIGRHVGDGFQMGLDASWPDAPGFGPGSVSAARSASYSTATAAASGGSGVTDLGNGYVMVVIGKEREVLEWARGGIRQLEASRR